MLIIVSALSFGHIRKVTVTVDAFLFYDIMRTHSNQRVHNPCQQGGIPLSTWGRMYQKVVRADILMLRVDTIALRSRTLILRSDRLQAKSDRIRLFFDTSIGGDPKKGSSNYLFNASKYLGTSSSHPVW